MEEGHDLYLCVRDGFLEFNRSYWGTDQFFSDHQLSELHIQSVLVALRLIFGGKTRLEILPAATLARNRLGFQKIRASTSYPRIPKTA